MISAVHSHVRSSAILLAFGLLCAVAVLLTLSACSAPGAKVHEAPLSQAAVPRAPTADDGRSPDPSIDEIIRRCNAIQASQDIPVGCGLRHLRDGSTIMLIVFPSFDYVRTEFAHVAAAVCQPFCRAAVRDKQRASLVMGVYTASAARTFDCSSGVWSEWFPVDFSGLEDRHKALPPGVGEPI